MKDNKEYLKDIYNKYEQEKDKTTIFYNTNINKTNNIIKINFLYFIIILLSSILFILYNIFIYSQ